jgi:hypothetical protein
MPKENATTAYLACVVCHEVDTIERALARARPDGTCGLCGGAFKVIRAT